MQIVLEFMDKSMKGMVSGDLSSFAINTIEKQIQGYLPRMEQIQKEIE